MFVATPSTNNSSVFDVKKVHEDAMENISRLYSYTKGFEDGRVVLRGKHVSMFEVDQSLESKQKYGEVLLEYINYVKEHYEPCINVSGVDVEECFKEEILDNFDKKVPMFFAYRNDGRLLGTVGSRHFFSYKDKNGVEQRFNEYSIRFTNVVKSCGFSGKGGVEAFFIFYLFALNEETSLFSYSYKHNRDLFFHFAETTNQCFLGCVKKQQVFASKATDWDVFASYKVDERTKERLMNV